MKENTQVYIITAGPYIKIGHSNNTGQRFNDLQVGCPLQFELVWLSEMTKKPIAEMLETRIHGRFDFQKVRGEWFDTNPIPAERGPAGRTDFKFYVLTEVAEATR